MLARMRRLLAVVSLIVFVDTMLFSAIIPLVPIFADDLDLSKFEAGLLVGAYGAGAMVGGIPSGLLASRIGPKRAVIVGLLLLSLTTAAFAFGSSATELGLARLGQGAASAVTWAGALAWLTLGTPQARRGRTLGTAFGFAVLGFIIGPAIGALGHVISIRGVFVAIAAVAATMAVIALWFPAGPSEVRRPRVLREAVRDIGFVTAVWITLVPALFFGVLDVLVPLSLSKSGWGTIAIAATFVCAGAIEVALAPLVGGVSDRRGRLYPIRAALGLMAAVALGFSFVTPALLVALLVVGASFAASGIYAPGIALVSDCAEANRMPQTLAFGVMNTSWAVGAMAGPAAGGALAQAIGDPAPYVVCAVLALVTAVAVSRTSASPQTA